MRLIGDIGNTETKIFLLDKNYKIIKRFVLSTNKISELVLKKKFKFIIKNNILIEKSLFCSVVPKIFLIIKTFVTKNFKSKCIELKNLNLSKLMKIDVNRKQVGSDRIANCLAVTSKKKNYIILDFGTATTFDVIIGNKYKGGVIAPGVSISLKTLIKKASLIPPLDLKKTRKTIGKNTVDAVRSGFFWGYVGLINNIIELIKKETKKSFKVIITGGFSVLFVNSLRFKVTIDKDITLKGLIKASKLISF